MSAECEMREKNGVTIRLCGDFADRENACRAVIQAMLDICRAQQVASGPLDRDTTSLPEQYEKEE